MTVQSARAGDLDALAELAGLLWPDTDGEALRQEMRELLRNGDCALFLAAEGDRVTGFAQCQLRHDYVEGTESSPVGYLEGIYVRADFRGRGTARALLRRCEEWAARRGCREFASDCELTNAASLAFHRKAGFTEANRIICFTKQLEPPKNPS